MFIFDRWSGAQQFRGLVMIADHRRNLGRVGKIEHTPDSPDLSPSIPDVREYLRFRVFISRQNLGQSGNSKIPDRLGKNDKTESIMHGVTRALQLTC